MAALPLVKRSKLPTIILALLILGCGKRGDPTPPVPLIPQTISDLTATQQGTTVVLSWTFPSLTTAGRNLKSLNRIFVYRYIEPLPAALVGQDPRTLTDVPVGTPTEVALFSQVRPLAPQQFVKLKETLATLEKEELAAATEGGRILFEDQPPIRTEDDRPVRVTYGVITEAQARSDLSNLAMVIPLDVPRAPRELTFTLAPDAVTLKWQPPELTLTGGENPSIVGYNIYRFTAAEPPSDLGAPLNPAPIAETSYRDTPPYGTHRYAVTAVRSAGPPLLQSVTSNTVTVEYVDLLPPPTPIGLTALPEEGGIRLIWEPVDAPDLAGYKVYRDGTLVTSAPITDAFFLDTRVVANIAYTYRVTSVDQRGNESAPAVAADVIIRR